MVYDIGIIGAGAAGLHLLQAMLEEPYFQDKKIVLIDKDAKESNDKTWCFWELSKGKWDEIVAHQWAHGKFNGQQQEITLHLDPYRYKMIRAIDFYDLARQKAGAASQVEWLQAEVRSVGNFSGKPVILLENGQQITVDYLFDSRIDKAFYQETDPYYRVWQHFKGWVIETEEEVFNPEEFVMMDFRIKHQDTTSFTYILPFSSRKALVEFTFFSPEIVDEAIYEKRLKEYISNILGVSSFEIRETEKGVIPMSDYPFHTMNADRHMRIGTAGSWVKPSSGYSFKNSERKARQIVANLKSGKSPASNIIKRRHRLYDTLFLDQLYRNNQQGESLFTTMYTSNDVQSIFRFLDEETTFQEEIAIMKTFTPWPFIGAFGRSLARHLIPVT